MSVLPYKVIFEQRPAYLFAFIEGEKTNFETAYSYWQELAEECRRRGARRLLISQAMREYISMGEMHRLVKEVAKLDFSGIRIAYVDPFLQNYDLNKFGQLAANNRGMFAKIFKDFAEGEKWLLSDEDLFK